MRTIRAIAPKGTAFNLEPLVSYLASQSHPDCRALLGQLKKLRRVALTISDIARCNQILLHLVKPEKYFGRSLQECDAALIHGMLTGFLATYYRAMHKGNKSRVGVDVGMAPSDDKMKKLLFLLRNKVFAHLDTELPSEIGHFHEEKLVLVHLGFGEARIKLAGKTRFFDDSFLNDLYDHIWRVIESLQEIYLGNIEKVGEGIKILTLHNPEVGNLIESQPFDAHLFFEDAQRAQAFIMDEELSVADLWSRVHVSNKG